ncbi:alanine aminotransferase 1 isoform X2 [Halyomorpha halys]|uniref:alanine aminotransferase 1 isoform X2 n=1 Tax=Halyomorpha halys TaxID=286706 RepID=UPI0034D162E9
MTSRQVIKGKEKPFDRVIRANIGDCHAVGQSPITFIRQVLALVLYPELLSDPTFPKDAKERARTILKECEGSSIGSYPDPLGIEIIRRHCAEYIKNRDGFPADWQNIILGNGASDAIKAVMNLFVGNINGKKAGVMVPIPQYPLFSATISQFNMHLISYYLDESTNWSLSISELERAVNEAKKCCNPRIIAVINPGNPTGQVLTRKNIEEIIKFSYKENLFILADEVYQLNVYDSNSKFYSFKKVLMEMGPPYNKMELASFMSCSKGYLGECGLRGAYCEIINLDPDVQTMFIKSLSVMLCPNTIGQTVLDCVVTPLKKEDPSYELLEKEKNFILDSFKERAKMVYEAFNSFEGMSCNVVQGAMYAFPQIKLPPKAIEKAKSLKQDPSVFYAFQLLEETGVCIIPGAGFGQVEGTYHFRTTILPQPEDLKHMLSIFKAFHEKFLAKYK